MKTYTVKEIATILNTNPETVRRWIRSGKLEATQQSKKQGNVVTEIKLNEFIKGTTKYTLPLTLISPAAGLAYSSIVLLGGLLVREHIKKENEINSDLDPKVIEGILNTEIQAKTEQLKKKEETIQQIKEEIEELQASIEQLKSIINSMPNKQTQAETQSEEKSISDMKSKQADNCSADDGYPEPSSEDEEKEKEI